MDIKPGWQTAIHDTLGVLLSVAGAGLAGWIRLASPEPGQAVLWLVGNALIIGYFFPANAWRWGLLLTLGLPAAHLLGDWLPGLPHTGQSGTLETVYITLLALAPVLGAVLAGSTLRKLIELQKILPGVKQ